MSASPVLRTCQENTPCGFSFRLCPLNPKTGDFAGNVKKIIKAISEAYEAKIDLLVLPELVVSGYNLGDLFFHSRYLDEIQKALKTICDATPDSLTVILGVALSSPRSSGKSLVNLACVIEKQQISFCQEKTFLASDDVFYEPRYFEPSEQNQVFLYKGYRLGLIVCEDLWNPLKRDITPAQTLSLQGADLLISINASPFHEQKRELRLALARKVVQEYQVPLAYVNLIGGEDDLLFDGHSFFVNQDSQVCEQDIFCEQPLDLTFPTAHLITDKYTPNNKVSRWQTLHKALVLGLRDYVHKSGFARVHLGLSGGIDSALVAKLASDALGKENVVGILMPSPYSSSSSIQDAQELATRLGIETLTIPIGELLKSFHLNLSMHFPTQGLVEENLQARLRGTILMAYSNAYPSLLLTTGNKSELAVGYCTLYGDMNGGFNPIGDIYKTDVFALCNYLNKQAKCFPENILTKPPSAELRPNQKDEDSLPPYPILDAILKELIEGQNSYQEAAKLTGQSPELVHYLARLVTKAEFKRFQSAPLLKVTALAFGSGRRMPLAGANFDLIQEKKV